MTIRIGRRCARSARPSITVVALVLCIFPCLTDFFGRVVRAQEADREVTQSDLRAGGDDNKRYFLIEDKNARPPADGFGLLVVMPGGAGGAEFNPFVKRIAQFALPAGYIVAQPVAKKWADAQPVSWPTTSDRPLVKEMKFTTEEFVESVIDDAAARHKLDPRKMYTLSWSSSGPAAYAISLSSPRVVGSLVAMSVFKPERLPKLDAARERAYYLFHSRGDRVCPFRMAELGVKELTEHGAKVTLVEYEGVHGWRMPTVFNDIRAGVEWLERNAVASPAGFKAIAVAHPAEKAPPPADKAGDGAKKDAEKKTSEIDGMWTLVSASNDGFATPAEAIKRQKFEITIDDGRFVMRYSDRKPRKIEYAFKVDPTKSPKQIDLSHGPNDVSLGIYKLDGNRLTICYPDGSTSKPAASGVRSTGFESVAGSINDVLLVLERVKK